MPWVFGSFLMTLCALTNYHVVINKQNSTIRALGYNRCITERRPRDENHAVRLRQRQRSSRTRDTQQIRGVSDKHAKGASVGTPWLLVEDMRRSPLSEYMSLHPSLTHHRNISPFENKVWEIHFYKEVCSFVHRCRKLSLIMFPLVFVLRLHSAYSPITIYLHTVIWYKVF